MTVSGTVTVRSRKPWLRRSRCRRTRSVLELTEQDACSVAEVMADTGRGKSRNPRPSPPHAARCTKPSLWHWVVCFGTADSLKTSSSSSVSFSIVCIALSPTPSILRVKKEEKIRVGPYGPSRYSSVSERAQCCFQIATGAATSRLESSVDDAQWRSIPPPPTVVMPGFSPSY